MKNVFIRFYEELNDFLPNDKRKIRFSVSFKGQPSVKDLIESLGVPHNEIDLIIINGLSVGFDYIISEGDDISVYPVFESFDIKDVQHLRSAPLRNPLFIADVHLGSLAKYLRMTGFDTLYNNNLSTEEIINISIVEGRTILSKDRELMKRKDVTHAYWIRNNETFDQLKEVIYRFQLDNLITPFFRCIECNGRIIKTEKELIIDRLKENTKKYFNEFFICTSCSRIYWKGSHYINMVKIINRLLESA